MKYHPWPSGLLTARRGSGAGTAPGGQFDWGGFLQKGNGGVRRSAHRVWQARARAQGHKPASLQDRRVEQPRKRDLVIQRWKVASPLLIGQKVLWG